MGVGIDKTRNDSFAGAVNHIRIRTVTVFLLIHISTHCAHPANDTVIDDDAAIADDSQIVHLLAAPWSPAADTDKSPI